MRKEKEQEDEDEGRGWGRGVCDRCALFKTITQHRRVEKIPLSHTSLVTSTRLGNASGWAGAKPKFQYFLHFFCIFTFFVKKNKLHI